MKTTQKVTTFKLTFPGKSGTILKPDSMLLKIEIIVYKYQGTDLFYTETTQNLPCCRCLNVPYVELQVSVAPEFIHLDRITDVKRIATPDIFEMVCLAEGYSRKGIKA